MATFRFGRLLTLPAWEADFGHQLSLTDIGGSRRQSVAGDSLKLDFTEVEFVDFGALARSLLLVGAHGRQGQRVTVTLPATDLTASEKRHVRQLRDAGRPDVDDVRRRLEHRVRARSDAVAFMRQVGFLDALGALSWPAGGFQVLEGAASTAAEFADAPSLAIDNADRDLQDHPYRPRRVLPFRWIEPIRPDDPRESRAFVTMVDGLESLGLSASDANALSQTVLTELLQSVAAPTGAAPARVLVGAILLTAEACKLRQQEMSAQFHELADCAMSDGSHVLRLIVANPGASLISDLARPGAAGPAPESADPDAAVAEQAIYRALGQWPADRPSPEAPRRAERGLWRVAHMVRSYRGSVMVRAADALAGVFFSAPDASGSRISEPGLGPLPGALLEVNVLTDPQVRPAWRPLGHPATAAEAARMPWVMCTLDRYRGISDRDHAAVAEAAASASGDPFASGVVVTVCTPDGDRVLTGDEIAGAMSRLFGAISPVAAATGIVLVLPELDPRVLDLCVTAFNEEISAEDRVAPGGGPVLVLAGHGGPLWCGGSAALRAVLARLTGPDGSTRREAEQRWAAEGGSAADFGPALAEYSHLIREVGERLQPRVSPQAAYRSLAQSVHGQLLAAITDGQAGVFTGRFRGPTLRVTSRWVDLERLLSETVGVGVGAFVLARLVDAELRASPQIGLLTGAIQVASTPWRLVRQVSECLGLGGRYNPTHAELDSGDLPVGDRVVAGADVVLCADVISTENSVRRAAATIAGGGAEPLVIACVIDARAERGPVRLLGRSIPVVSLTDVDLGYSGARADGAPGGGTTQQPATDIDPLLFRPALPAAIATRAPVRETELLRWCAADPTTLRLGHAQLPPHRHFSALVLLDRVLRGRKIRNKITDAFVATMDQALAEVSDGDGQAVPAGLPLEIWYVRSRDGNAGRLAEAVHRRLAALGRSVTDLVPVPRATAGESWAFPAAISAAEATAPAVVVVAWNTVTGATILQTIRLAARRGASCIVAISMLHQLDATESEALGMLRAVSADPAEARTGMAPGGDVPPARDGRVIPMAVRFFTASSISALPAVDCPICASRERYATTDAGMPARLRRHAAQLHDLLQPRSIEEISANSAADLYSVPISGSDVVDYLRWRGLLLRALRDTAARYEVIDRLRRLTERHSVRTWTRVGLIRLLAAEQQWLRLPPLRYAVARELLAQACIISLERSSASSWLRVQALIVLFASRPDRLAELLPRLFRHVRQDALLVDQMLLDCYRLLLRPPQDTPVDIDQIRRSLARFRDDLEQRRDGGDRAAIDGISHVVGELIAIADYRTLRMPEDAQAAWERLREDLVRPVIRHGLESDLLLVRSFVEDLQEIEPTPESAQKAQANWDTCARQLQQRVLVNLPALRDVLAGDYVADWFGPREPKRLRKLLQNESAGMRAVAGRLHQIASEPWQPAYPPWQALHQQLLNRLNWWNRMFLAAHVPDQHSPALLVDLIRSAPVRLAERVAAGLAAHGAEAAIDQPDQGDAWVFCPDKLLDQVVTHLIENVRRHCPVNGACRIGVRYERDGEEYVRLFFRNSNTRPRTPPGQGLSALARKLRPFGGMLESRVLANGEWTFEAVVTLPLWHRG